MASDYTIRCEGKIYQIARGGVVAGLRGANVRVERRLDGSLAARFREKVLELKECSPATSKPAAKTAAKPVAKPAASTGPKKSQAQRFGQIDLRKGLPVWIAGQIG